MASKEASLLRKLGKKQVKTDRNTYKTQKQCCFIRKNLLHTNCHKSVVKLPAKSGEIRRVINQFKETIMHSSHCNHRLVCRKIFLMKQYHLWRTGIKWICSEDWNVQIIHLFESCSNLVNDYYHLCSCFDTHITFKGLPQSFHPFIIASKSIVIVDFVILKEHQSFSVFMSLMCLCVLPVSVEVCPIKPMQY